MEKKSLNVIEVVKGGCEIGVKNAASLVGALFLWIITIWIPYLNVGTTIAINTIPLELSKGKVISPFFIFDGKYRQYMGEYFTLIGLMGLAIIPALFFLIVPGIIIALGWSLALYILLDKGVAPGEAMIRSNKATYGNKWSIFFVGLILCFVSVLLNLIAGWLGELFWPLLWWVIALVITQAISIGCWACIYKQLVLSDEQGPTEEPAEAPAETATEAPATEE